MRHRLVYITPELFVSILRNGVREFSGLPENAKYVRYFFDRERAAIVLVFESPAFDEVEPNSRIPELIITVTEHP